MDVITQGIVGATLAQTGSRESRLTQATISGFLAGMLADADILIRSANDPLLNIEYHRQFSHSLLFIPVGALIVSLILWPFMRRRLPFHWLYVFSLLGYSTAGILDACTSFGTQLLWPFSDERISWNLIAVVDPLFTIGVLLALIASWKLRKKIYAFIGIAYALAYLSLGYYQQQVAVTHQHQLALGRGHTIERSVIKPTLGNILLWRSVYLHDGQYYIDAIRAGIFSPVTVFAGNSIPVYRLPADRDQADAPVQSRDQQRFNSLSRGYLVIHPDDPRVIGDIRYSMLPNSNKPLWGIRLDPENPDNHVGEAIFRTNDRETRKQFMEMLLGP